MSLLYAVEGWVIAVVGFAYVTLRALIPYRSMMEETCAYSTLIVATIHLGACSAIRDKTELCKAYLGFTLIIWTYLAYALADGIDIYDLGSRLVPPRGGCCPNRDVPNMNRVMYFGGMSAFLIPGAISFAFATIQVMIAGAAMVASQGAIWPGNGWGYGVASMLAMAYFMRFYGFQVRLPCPEIKFDWIPGVVLSYPMVFGIFVGALTGMIVMDGITATPSLMMLSRGLGLACVGLFCFVVYVSSEGMGMFTVPVMALLGKAVIPPVWGVLEPWFRQDAPQQPTVSHRPPKVKTRWVMPINVGLDSALPCPVSLGPSADPRKKQA